MPIRLLLTTILALLLSSSAPLLAVENPQTLDDITNSATIGVNQLESPVLIAPCDHCVTRNRFETFSWYRSLLNNVDHYQLVLDHTTIAEHILPHTSEETDTYITVVTAEKIFLTLKTPFSEGPHTWMVQAVAEDVHADSETWSFTVDTTNPIIILQAVDKNVMYWATNDPASIPPIEQRQLTVTTKDPLLSGKVEAGANLKLSLVCPYAALAQGCTHQSAIIIDPDGNWEHRFYGLLPNITYSVFLSATDAAGNSNYFPEFTITYTPARITFPPFLIPPGVIKPRPSLTPTPTPVAPPPSYIEEITPYKAAPPIPSEYVPPPPSRIPSFDLTGFIVWGLLLHLLFLLSGFRVGLPLLLPFTTALLFPFIRSHNGLTSKANSSHPLDFVRLLVYSAGDKPRLLKRLYSQTTALFTLNLSNQDLVLIKADRAGFEAFSALFSTQQRTPFTYLLPLVTKDHQTLSDRLCRLLISLRLLPLLIAVATSFYAVAILKITDIYYLLYLITSLYLLFIEYIYKRLIASNHPQNSR